MNDDELVNKLFTAYSLIARIAKASEIMLERLTALEATVAKLEAADVVRKASAR